MTISHIAIKRTTQLTQNRMILGCAHFLKAEEHLFDVTLQTKVTEGNSKLSLNIYTIVLAIWCSH
jgi:hypothetical protein